MGGDSFVESMAATRLNEADVILFVVSESFLAAVRVIALLRGAKRPPKHLRDRMTTPIAADS
jgi:hypothetical protein